MSRSEYDTYRCEPEQASDDGPVLDISAGACTVPDSSNWHPAYSKFLPIPQSEPTLEANVSETQQDLEEEITEAEPVNIDYEVLSEEILAEVLEDEPEMQVELMHTDEDNEIVEPDEEEEDVVLANADEMMQDSYEANAPFSHISRPQITSKLPCNFFLTGETDAFLIDSTDGKRQIYCKTALVQKLPPGYSEFRHMQRLNMIHQIPELGVIAVADQRGRVGLFTSTFWAQEKRHGFKLEIILPLRSEEEQEKRPHKPLLGMTISPIQGQQPRAYSPSESSSEDGKIDIGRFRLMMYYYDHTILAYELSRLRTDAWVLIS